MQVLIVEDEMLLVKQLKHLLTAAEPSAIVAGVCQSVAETVQWLQHHTPDVILMDIELADGQSFDIFEQTTVHAPVIFTTAYDEYAIRAFKVNSIDYLLKPIKEEELKTAIEKFKKAALKNGKQDNMELLLAEIKKMQQQAEYRNRFLVKQGQKMISITTNETAYFFSENGCTFLRTAQNQKFMVEYTLDELENMLSPKSFFRANRQFILHHQSVIAIHSWFNQKLKIEVKPAVEDHVIISREKAHAFKAWMGE